MYSLLTPIRYVLNPRFNLDTPLQSGLFYIAPGCGYLLGTFIGGRWADHIVKKYINKRGERIPEDRLRSCVIFLGGVIPACMVVYGWSVEKRVGGVSICAQLPLRNYTDFIRVLGCSAGCDDVPTGRCAALLFSQSEHLLLGCHEGEKR
jgi:MFS family permease